MYWKRLALWPTICRPADAANVAEAGASRQLWKVVRNSHFRYEETNSLEGAWDDVVMLNALLFLAPAFLLRPKPSPAWQLLVPPLLFAEACKLSAATAWSSPSWMEPAVL